LPQGPDTLQADTRQTLFRQVKNLPKGPDTLQGREIFAKGPVTLQGSEIICALNLLFSNPFVPTHKGDL
jgi:hypothetical protein